MPDEADGVQSAPFNPGDVVRWSPRGVEPQDVTVHAVDTRTDPPTYIVKLEDGSRRGARHSQLSRSAALSPPATLSDDGGDDEGKAFAIGDTATWAPRGVEPQDVTIFAVDTRTDPPTYIVKTEDGSRRGARHAQLQRRAGTRAASPRRALDQLAEEEAVSGASFGVSSAAAAADFAKKRAGGLMSGAMSRLKGLAGRTGTGTESRESSAGKHAQPRRGERSFASKGSAEAGDTPIAADLPFPGDAPRDSHDSHESRESTGAEEGASDGVARLVAMGFTAQRAEAALADCGGSVQRAAEALMVQGGGDTPPPAPQEARGDMPGWQRAALGLDAGAPPAAPAAARPAAARPPLRVLTPPAQSGGGLLQVELEWDAPAAGPAAPVGVSVGVRAAGTRRWTHHVPRDGPPARFADAGGWRAACHPAAARRCTVRGLRPGSAYDFSVRYATGRGPGPAAAPVSVRTPGAPPAGGPFAAPAAAAAPLPPAAAPAAPAPFDAFTDFVGTSFGQPAAGSGAASPGGQSPNPASAAASPDASPRAKRPPTKKYPPYAPGQIWDVD